MNVSANLLGAGDHVTGVWSEIRGRFDPVDWSVHRVTRWKAPDGTPIVTIQTGAQEWRSAAICADTRVRIRTHRKEVNT